MTEMWYKERMAPQGVKVYNPAFDVTPASLITAFVTERGVIRDPKDFENIGRKNIMDKAEMAQANFLKGYNCAQSVLLAFAPECGLSEETAAKLASSFGGGVARLREVCRRGERHGQAAGLTGATPTPPTGKPKSNHYALVRPGAEFRAEFAPPCREL